MELVPVRWTDMEQLVQTRAMRVHHFNPEIGSATSA
jgi:hypothetical protein